MTSYAQGTSVSANRSVAEISHNVKRFGASEFGYIERPGAALVGFAFQGYRVELGIDLPGPDEFAMTRTGRRRTARQQAEQCAQEARRRWRALAQVVKILCMAVDEGVLTFEEAFLAHLVLGDGRTVGHTLLPRLQEARDQGALPSSLRMDHGGRLLPGPVKGGQT